jgi:fructose-bisphosphate aldolase class 1
MELDMSMCCNNMSIIVTCFNPNIIQDNGLVPIVEPEILLDGDHGIERTLEVAEKVWSEVFFYLAQNNVLFEGILLKPSMVTPGAEHKEKASPEAIAKHTLTMLRRRVPPAVPGIMVLIVLSLSLNQLCCVSHRESEMSVTSLILIFSAVPFWWTI